MTITTRRALLGTGIAAALALTACRNQDDPRAHCNTNCDPDQPETPTPAPSTPTTEAPPSEPQPNAEPTLSFQFEDTTGTVGTLVVDDYTDMTMELEGWATARGGSPMRYLTVTVDNTNGTDTVGMQHVILLDADGNRYDAVDWWDEIETWRNADDDQATENELTDLRDRTLPKIPVGDTVQTVTGIIDDGNLPDMFTGGVVYLKGLTNEPAYLIPDT